MKKRRIIAAGSAFALASAGAFAFSMNSASADPLETDINDAKGQLDESVNPGLLDALTDELGISAEEAKQRLAVESVASDIEQQVAGEDGYAGLWLNEDSSEIIVGTTGSELSTDGVTYVDVEHSLETLSSVTDELDAHGADAFEQGVYGWFVDVTSNNVVVEADSDAKAADFVDAAGVDADLVTFDTDAEAPQLFHVTGGDEYSSTTGGCSVGFAATKDGEPGFTTAGHCGTAGTSVTGGNAAPGEFVDSDFPGTDEAWVSTETDDLRAEVLADSGTESVTDSDEASVGSSICRSGQTTGWQCGEVEALDQSVSYPEGTVNGMTQTSACAEPGDSGGSFIAGSSAQGMTSGGSGSCSAGGTTYFQPLNPTLDAYGLELVTQ